MQFSHLFKINFLSRDTNFQYGGLLDRHFEFFKPSYLPYFKSDFHEIFNKLNFSSSFTVSNQFIIYHNNSIYWDTVCIGTHSFWKKIIILTIILIGTY